MRHVPLMAEDGARSAPPSSFLLTPRCREVVLGSGVYGLMRRSRSSWSAPHPICGIATRASANSIRVPPMTMSQSMPSVLPAAASPRPPVPAAGGRRPDAFCVTLVSLHWIVDDDDNSGFSPPSSYSSKERLLFYQLSSFPL